jgi:hypothetical protein
MGTLPQSSAKPLVPTQRSLETSNSRIRVPNIPKDAFDGLGFLSDRPPALTLGDVQKARTDTSTSGLGPEPAGVSDEEEAGMGHYNAYVASVDGMNGAL